MSRPGPVAHVVHEEDWAGERWYFELRKASGTVLHKEGPFRLKSQAIEARAELVGTATRARYLTDEQ
jgi:hypothetical protein